MLNKLAKTIRHQISLNTCQGCHSDENKTNFTHVYPRGFGQEANYWDAIPTVVNNIMVKDPIGPVYYDNSIDNRFRTHSVTNAFNINNLETTFNTYVATHKSNLDFIEKTTNNYNQVVSPFLTGRKYSNVIGNNWQDDELDDAVKEWPIGTPGQLSYLADNKLTGLYILNDASNQSASTIGNGLSPGDGGSFPQLHTTKWGNNDLQRRKEDMCLFLSQNCNFPSLIKLMQHIKMMPLPLHSH
jgi:hypothetical protein